MRASVTGKCKCCGSVLRANRKTAARRSARKVGGERLANNIFMNAYHIPALPLTPTCSRSSPLHASCTQTSDLATSLYHVDFLTISSFRIIFIFNEIFIETPWLNIFVIVYGFDWNDCRVWRMRASTTH